MISNIREIFKSDLSATLKNPVVIFVLLALIILPSLYSVINIYGCWDPYEDTDNMDFIIVNNDNPVVVNGVTYDYGREIVSSLKENNNFNWVYKDEDEARGLVRNGSNYAAVIIPESFTEDILSINTDNPRQAKLQYIDNKKSSPVAPKITSNAATKVNTEISDSIMEKYSMKSYSQTPVVVQDAANQTGVGADSSMSAAGNYFHSPTVLSNYSYYEADNYAQQVAAFYTVLASWVGCIILVALLSVKPVENEEKYRPVEVYAGKMGLFVVMNILQSVVSFIGLNLFGVTIVDPVMTMFSIFMVGLSFMIVIYSLVSVFGNVGKAVALIILVFQISGTNGIYPIEIMSPVIHGLMPYLPMTYGILMLKDSIFGIIWPSFIANSGHLLVFPVVAVAFSVIVKEKLDKRSRYFNDSLNESNLFELR